MRDESRRAAEFEHGLEERRAGGEPAQREADSIEELALRVRQRLAPPPASTAFAATARRRLLLRLPREVSRPLARPLSGVLRRLAYAAASVLLAFALGTAGVAYAAQEAIPGDSLYGAKRAVEAARWSLTLRPQSQAALLSDLAAERVAEAQALADTGRDTLLVQTLQDYDQTLDHLQVVAETLPDEVRGRVLAQAAARVQQHQKVLERLLKQVPPQAAPAIERAIDRSSHGQQVLDALQQGASPSDLAPGQNKTKVPGPKRTPGPPETKPKPR